MEIMKIYDELTHEEIASPDLSAGYVYDGVLVTGRTEAHTEVMAGTVTQTRPAGLRRMVPARNITEPCQYYHKYTAEELTARQEPSSLDRIEAQVTYTAMMTDTLLEV